MAKFLGVGWHFPISSADVKGQEPFSDKPFAPAYYEESIRQSIWIILNTNKGERVMRPDFGCDLAELVFAPNNAETRGLAGSYVREALKEWEPRIADIEVVVTATGITQEILQIEISYRVRLTDNRFNLVYPFYLERGGLGR